MTSGTFPSLAIGCLSAGFLFRTLQRSFGMTSQAGIERLPGKYPRASSMLARWGPRWSLLCSGLGIIAAGLQAAALITGCLAMLRHDWNSAWLPAVTAAGALALLYLMLHLLPGLLAARYADRLSVLFLPPVVAVTVVLWPLAWSLIFLESRIRRVFLHGAPEEYRPTPEDAIRSMVLETEGTDLEPAEKKMICSVFEFGDTVTREIMTPRVDIEGLEDSDSLAECARKISAFSHSRFPIYRETMDDIQGVAHVRDLLGAISNGRERLPASTIAKPVPFVPESMPINDLLQLLRTEQSQIAVVVDEYGGTAGVVTVEDILEELVGEIQDEYDDEEHHVHSLSDGSCILTARLPVAEVNELLGVHLPQSEEYDSIGGYLFHALGRIPRPGEVHADNDYRIVVQTATPRGIETVRVQRLKGNGDRTD